MRPAAQGQVGFAAHWGQQGVCREVGGMRACGLGTSRGRAVVAPSSSRSRSAELGVHLEGSTHVCIASSARHLPL